MKYKLLTIKEVAEFLQVSEMTIRRLVWRQKLTAYKPSGELRFLEKDVFEFFESSKYRLQCK